MQGKQRRLPAEFKTRWLWRRFRAARRSIQVATRFEVHPTQVRAWKRPLEQAATDPFGARRHRREQDDQEPVGHLHRQIGQFKVELDWLKKIRSPD